MSKARQASPARRRSSAWYDDPLVESERPVAEALLKLEPPMVQDHHASTVLYDAYERPVRRQIGFRQSRCCKS